MQRARLSVAVDTCIRRDGGCAGMGLMCVFIPFMVVGAWDLVYVRDHPFSHDDVESAHETALVFCSADACVSQRNCTQFNTFMALGIAEGYVFESGCQDLCVACAADPVRQVRCQQTCIDRWTRFQYVLDREGTELSVRYTRGVILLSLMALVGCVWMRILIRMDELRAEDAESDRMRQQWAQQQQLATV